jgi:hypothetical protein
LFPGHELQDHVPETGREPRINVGGGVAVSLLEALEVMLLCMVCLFYLFRASRTYLHNKAPPGESTYHSSCEYKPKKLCKNTKQLSCTRSTLTTLLRKRNGLVLGMPLPVAGYRVSN